MRRAAWAATLAIAAGVAGASNAGLESARAGRGVPAQVLYLPSGDYLKVISIGFPQLLADLIYIWSIQYYSNYEAEDRFRYLEHVYAGVIAKLDPHYIDPYLVGALIMGAEAQDHEMALRLLDRGIEANPGDWILPFEAGFICYNDLKDYARAARYFETAIAVPGAPPPIRRMHAEMFNRMGDKEASLAHWREIHDTADSDYVKDVAWRHVHDLTLEIDLDRLEAGVRAWRERTGRNPRALADLVRAGVLDAVPLDPDGRAYEYDPATGEVRSASRWRLYRKIDR